MRYAVAFGTVAQLRSSLFVFEPVPVFFDASAPGTLSSSDVIAAPVAGVPVQPVMPCNVWPLVLVYLQVPLIPTPVNCPFVGANPSTDFTIRLPPATSWPAPSTTVP